MPQCQIVSDVTEWEPRDPAVRLIAQEEHGGRGEGVLGRWTRWIVVIGAAAAVTVGLAGWYAYDRTGPRDAGTAQERLRTDMQALASELGLREVTRETADDPNAAGEECGIWQGDRELTRGPHRQLHLTLQGLPPRGRAPTELRADTERILRRLGYQIITDQVHFVVAPPDGHVIATWGWSDRVEITLWPEPEAGTVRINGAARCLPVP
jgi:hypothetical protein